MQEHFESHFNNKAPGDPPEHLTTNIPGYISDLKNIPFDNSKTHNDPPEIGELRASIMRLKNGKASTDVQTEFV